MAYMPCLTGYFVPVCSDKMIVPQEFLNVKLLPEFWNIPTKNPSLASSKGFGYFSESREEDQAPLMAFANFSRRSISALTKEKSPPQASTNFMAKSVRSAIWC